MREPQPRRARALILPLLLAITACQDSPTQPRTGEIDQRAAAPPLSAEQVALLSTSLDDARTRLLPATRELGAAALDDAFREAALTLTANDGRGLRAAVARARQTAEPLRATDEGGLAAELDALLLVLAAIEGALDAAADAALHPPANAAAQVAGRP